MDADKLKKLVEEIESGRQLAKVEHNCTGPANVTFTFDDGEEVEASAAEAKQMIAASDNHGLDLQELLDSLED
jgi:hypothetical protein